MAPKHDIMYVSFYTDGSAARKMSPAFPAQQPHRRARRSAQKKTVLYVDPVAVCSLLVAAFLLVAMAVGLTQLQNATAQAQAMESYLEQLTLEQEQLAQQYAQQLDLESVERTALALGMVPKEQVKTVSITLQDAPAPTQSLNIWEQFLAILTNLFA